MMREAEEFDNASVVRAGTVPEAVLGQGDLLDDFVLSASQAPPAARDFGNRGHVEDEAEDDGEWDFASVVDSDDGDADRYGSHASGRYLCFKRHNK